MHPLVSTVVALQRRLAWRRRLGALCRVLAVVLGAIIVLGLADFTIQYVDRGLRLMATALLVVLGGWAIYRWWYRALRPPLSRLAVARSVESRFPELNDALTSALEFLDQPEGDLAAGSPLLRRAVINAAESKVSGLPLSEVIDRAPLRRAAAWLGLAGLIALLLSVWNPPAARTAVARLVAPLGSAQWPRENHLLFRNPPSRIAVGQPFEVELVDANGNLPEVVRIEYRLQEPGLRTTFSNVMTRVGDSMVAHRDDIRQSFAFRAIGGDDNTMPWHYVEVVAPPRLESLSITVHPPKYTGQPPFVSDRQIEVLSGSGIEVAGLADQSLARVRVVLGGDNAIEGKVQVDQHEKDKRRFTIQSSQWIASSSGSYRIELEDAGGASAVAAEGSIRVEADSPPSVSWQRPADDLHVTTSAIVPLELAVGDDLAIAAVELFYARVDGLASNRAPTATEAALNESVVRAEPTRLELYRGPTSPSLELRPSHSAEPGESRVIEYNWDLDPLRLPAGAQLELFAEAVDYRPATGRTSSARRISIISPAELEARLVDRQNQIARQLEQALAIQQAVRDDLQRLEIQQREVGELAESDQNSLRASELSQRRVDTMVGDHSEGIPALADLLQSELDMNRVALADVREKLRELRSALAELSSGPLSAARHALRSSSELVDSHGQGERLRESLAAAGQAQEVVIAELERLSREWSSAADFGRFVREIASLRQDQLAHIAEVRDTIGIDTLPLEMHELGPAQRAAVNKSVVGAEAIERRFAKIVQGMQELAAKHADDDDPSRVRLRAALELAGELGISVDMHDAVANLRENRVGRALSLEDAIAGDLQQLLDVLRNQREHDPQRFVDKLRAAETRLRELRDKLASARDELARVEQLAPDDVERGQAGQQADQLRQQIDSLARELNRLGARDAAESTSQASQRLSGPNGNNRPSASSGPPPSAQQAQRAEEDLAKATEQLASRRARAENDLALEFVRRFESELREMVERQKNVVAATTSLAERSKDQTALSPDDARRAAELADEEHALAALAREHGELLFGLTALRLSLDELAAKLESAAELLSAKRPFAEAMQVEHEALARLEGIQEALSQTATEAGQNSQGKNGEGDAGGEERRPTFELLEVKVLRMLQLALNKRTERHKRELASIASSPPNDRRRDELARTGKELAAEQARLAELVEELLRRDNEQ